MAHDILVPAVVPAKSLCRNGRMRVDRLSANLEPEEKTLMEFLALRVM